MSTPYDTATPYDHLAEAYREIDKLNADLVEVAAQRDRLKRQVLADTADNDWRMKINAALAPLVRYEDDVLLEPEYTIALRFEPGDRPPLELRGALETDNASEAWTAQLDSVDWVKEELSFMVEARG